MMKKKTLAVLLALAVCMSVFGCGGNAKDEPAVQSDETTEAESVDPADGAEEAQSPEMEYISPDGWRVRYDGSVIESSDIDEHTASFVYTGESAGSSLVTISFAEGKQPEEAMSEITSDWGENQTRTEGFFPGTDDMWGYWRTLESDGSDSGLSETVIGGQYGDGALVFDVVIHKGEDEGMNSVVSDALSEIVDSITYDDFPKQDMYDYIPGTYVQAVGEEYADGATDPDAKYTVVLNEDHTGTLSLQDDVEILWGSYELMAADGSFTYEYSIEGEDILINYDGEVITFSKE